MQDKKENSSLRKQELFFIQLLISLQKDLTKGNSLVYQFSTAFLQRKECVSQSGVMGIPGLPSPTRLAAPFVTSRLKSSCWQRNGDEMTVSGIERFHSRGQHLC